LFVAVQQGSAQEGCSECEQQVEEQMEFWTNVTSVEELLESLDQNCINSYPHQPMKTSICEEIAAIAVQIPPGLFQGLETLAWPIPLGVCATIGKCETVCCDDSNNPEQIHLSLPGMGVTAMGVSWVTLDEGPQSLVEYRVVDGNESVTNIGDTTTYKWGSWIGTIHRAMMTELSPATKYEYRVGDGSIMSDWIQFTTLPSSEMFQASSDQVINFAIIGDMGYGNKSNATVANLIDLVDNGELDVVIHSGDVGYADGFMPHWDVFMNKVQSIASRIPYMVVPGNHEIWYNFSAYKHRFMMPGVDLNYDASLTSGSGDNMYYEWGLPGLVHFLAADSETAVDTANFGAVQESWMDEVLARADENRDETPWSLAHFHRPLYCSNSGECNGNDGLSVILRNQGEAMFNEHHVDLIFEAHVHSYERSFPMVNGSATQFDYDIPTAPVYIVQGSSGDREGNPGFPTDLPDWSAAHSSNIGFGLMSMSRTKIDFTYYTANDVDGPQVTDQFTMMR
jgi:3',5'-cyclic AMP phosphodiesterase CpdA